jgi:Caspase domain
VTLWLDRRSQLAASPGTHALVIATSRYDHLPEPGAAPPTGNETFGLVQARSPASGAFGFAKWLRDSYVNPEAPLASVDVLVTPSAQEAAADAELAAVTSSTLRSDVQQAIYAWRDRCTGQREGVAILYVSGHGIQVSRQDAIVLLQDFAKERRVLDGAIDIGSVFYGMRGEDLPARQFFFVDACRIRPEAFNRYASLGTGVGLDEPQVGDERRTAPMYFSASPDTAALGIPGTGTIFAQALLASLSGLAVSEYPDERGRWHVDVTSLQKALELYVQELAASYQDLQEVVTGGYVRNVPFHFYPNPPDLTVNIHLDPDAAAHIAQACVHNDIDNVDLVTTPFVSNPVRATVPAGFYTLRVTINPPTPPFQDRTRPLPVIPASVRQPVRVSVV